MQDLRLRLAGSGRSLPPSCWTEVQELGTAILNFNTITKLIKSPFLIIVYMPICTKSAKNYSFTKSIDVNAKGLLPVLLKFNDTCSVFRRVHNTVHQDIHIV